jgi:hypothetical protein
MKGKSTIIFPCEKLVVPVVLTRRSALSPFKRIQNRKHNEHYVEGWIFQTGDRGTNNQGWFRMPLVGGGGTDAIVHFLCLDISQEQLEVT